MADAACATASQKQCWISPGPHGLPAGKPWHTPRVALAAGQPVFRMRRATRRSLAAAASLAVLLGRLGLPAPAHAHKLTLFAVVQGKTISGEAFFRGGSPVRSAPVIVLDARGTRLGEASTDEEGKFAFEPRWRCDHRLVLRAGEGHAAEFTIAADELPRTLPARESPDGKTLADKPPVPPDPALADKPPVAPSAAIAELSERVEAVDRQVAELRKELARYEDKVRLHDVLGGIGCILGFMGLSFYFLGVRRKERLARAGE